MRLVFVFALSLFVITTNAQYSQQLRGTVTDQVLQQPLAGATVTISSLGKSVMTDEAGVFRFSILNSSRGLENDAHRTTPFLARLLLLLLR